MTTTATEPTVQQQSSDEYPKVVQYGGGYVKQLAPETGEWVRVQQFSGRELTVHSYEIHSTDVEYNGQMHRRLCAVEPGTRVICVDARNGVPVGTPGVVSPDHSGRVVRVDFEGGVVNGPTGRAEYVYNLALPLPPLDVTALAELLAMEPGAEQRVREEVQSEIDQMLDTAREAADEFDWCGVFEQACRSIGVNGRQPQTENVDWVADVEVRLENDSDLDYWFQNEFSVNTGDEYPRLTGRVTVTGTYEGAEQGACVCGNITRSDIDIDDRLTVDDFSLSCDNCS